jgi:hypothetical protein
MEPVPCDPSVSRVRPAYLKSNSISPCPAFLAARCTRSGLAWNIWQIAPNPLDRPAYRQQHAAVLNPERRRAVVPTFFQKKA